MGHTMRFDGRQPELEAWRRPTPPAEVEGTSMSSLKVWIDQDLCTGDGICVELQPGIFAMHDDGLAYVKEAAWSDIFNGSGTDPVYKMAEGTATVPQSHVDSTIEAAEECPGECIFLEITE
jgi:ferredoxin